MGNEGDKSRCSKTKLNLLPLEIKWATEKFALEFMILEDSFRG